MVLKNKQLTYRYSGKNKEKVVGANIGIGVKEYLLFKDKLAYVYTSEEHKNINSRVQSLKQEVDELKQQLDEANARIKELEVNKNEAIEDARTEIKNEFIQQIDASEKEIETLKEQHNAELDKQYDKYESMIESKNNTIQEQQELIQDKDKTIIELTEKAINVNEVINKYNNINIENANTHKEKMSKLEKEHYDEVSTLKEKHQKEQANLMNENIYLRGKYNGLRQAIANKSVFDFIFRNGKKEITTEYQELPPSDKEAIDTNTTD